MAAPPDPPNDGEVGPRLRLLREQKGMSARRTTVSSWPGGSWNSVAIVAPIAATSRASVATVGLTRPFSRRLR